MGYHLPAMFLCNPCVYSLSIKFIFTIVIIFRIYYSLCDRITLIKKAFHNLIDGGSILNRYIVQSTFTNYYMGNHVLTFKTTMNSFIYLLLLLYQLRT